MKLKRVLVTGLVPVGIQVARELARIHTDIRFDVIITENFDNSTTSATDAIDDNFPNIHYVIIKYVYIIEQDVTKENIKDASAIIGNFNTIPGNFSIHKSLISYVKENIELYDFVITTPLGFQQLKWFSDLKESTVIFCPDMQCADLEHDKLFAKQLLSDIGIPTPEFKILDQDRLIEEVELLNLPAVIKCNIGYTSLGYASWVFKNQSYRDILPRVQHAALSSNPSCKFYSEKFVPGEEISPHFLCNGKSWKFIGAARDYKKIKDGDQGMNTTGAGTYAPSEAWTPEIESQVFNYMDKLIPYLENIGMAFRGIMYLGIIIDDHGTAQVVEINTRPGSPEFQTILKTLDNSNLLENLYRASQGDDLLPITTNGKSAVSIALLNKNYTPEWKTETIMPSMKDIPVDIELAKSAHLLVSNNVYGTITTDGNTRLDASQKIYDYLETIEVGDFFYRTDIGRLR